MQVFVLKELYTAIYERKPLMFVIFLQQEIVSLNMQRMNIASAPIRVFNPGTSYIKCIKTGVSYQLLYFVYRIFINCMLQK